MAKRARLRSPRLERKNRQADGLRPPSASAAAAAGPPASPSPLPGPGADAVRLFETGIKALQRHVFGDAAGSFRKLLTGFPTERALLDRAKVYLELCDRELRRKPSEPQTVEERLTAATAALNNGDDERTERLARAVLADDARQDMALYLLAVVEARRGATDAAMAYLGQTIEICPEAKAQARYDADFDPLRSLPAFHELVDPPAASAGLSGLRRLRRGRP
jgi:hypothetical protein